jgi:hypothetical protein
MALYHPRMDDWYQNCTYLRPRYEQSQKGKRMHYEASFFHPPRPPSISLQCHRSNGHSSYCPGTGEVSTLLKYYATQILREEGLDLSPTRTDEVHTPMVEAYSSPVVPVRGAATAPSASQRRFKKPRVFSSLLIPPTAVQPFRH